MDIPSEDKIFESVRGSSGLRVNDTDFIGLIEESVRSSQGQGKFEGSVESVIQCSGQTE